MTGFDKRSRGLFLLPCDVDLAVFDELGNAVSDVFEFEDYIWLECQEPIQSSPLLDLRPNFCLKQTEVRANVPHGNS